MTRRYCRHCGAELQDGDRYCSECGQRLDPGADTGQHDDSREHDPQQDRGQSTGGARYATSTDSGQGHARGRQPNTGMAALTHVLALFTWLVGPLIVYLVTDDAFVKENAANAVNWQIMFAIYMLVAFVLVFAVVGFFLIFLLPLLDLALVVIAALKASDGEAWTYPLTPKIL